MPGYAAVACISVVGQTIVRYGCMVSFTFASAVTSIVNRPVRELWMGKVVDMVFRRRTR